LNIAAINFSQVDGLQVTEDSCAIDSRPCCVVCRTAVDEDRLRRISAQNGTMYAHDVRNEQILCLASNLPS